MTTQTHLTRVLSAGAAALGLLAFALVGGGCDAHSKGGSYPIEHTRQLRDPRPSNAGPVPDAERFGFRRSNRAQRNAPLAWKLPPGWSEKPPRQFREGNFAIDAHPEIDCYLSILPGANAGGGAFANVNRWRSQMGVESADMAAIAQLPTVGLLGVPAIFAEIEGTYGGMRGDTSKSGWKMIGVFADVGGAAVSVKMVGPAAEIDAEIGNLRNFCASVRQAEKNGHAHSGGSAGGAAKAGGAASNRGGGLKYEVPSGWAQGPAKQMRMVTFLPEDAADSPPWECYVMTAGGSLEANLNRWAGQVGRAALTAEDIANLPKLDVMGRASPLLDLTGKMGASQGTGGTDFRLLGVVCELPQQTLFVKMVGRADQMDGELERFKSFCESLRL